MQQTNKKKRGQRTSFLKPPHHFAVHRDSIWAPILHLEPGETDSVTNRGTNFIFGSVAGAAAATALHLAQIKTLQLLTTVGNQCYSNGRFAALLSTHLALLSLNRQQGSAGFNTNGRDAHPCLSVAMYRHPSQQPASQPFTNGPRPPHHQPPPNQHQNRPASDMMVMGFQFPRPTQLPDELESALAIRGARDMDHRLIDHTNRPNQHQNQSSGSVISQHGSYGSSPIALTSDNQPAHQQGVDWSNYQPPTKLFASSSASANHQPARHQGPQQQTPSSHTGTTWNSDSPSQTRHPHGDGQGMYTPESAGSILASFGLSNEDLEVLSHYPDDQLTPDTLPFILRDIQINKSGNQKTAATTSASSFQRNVNDIPLRPSRSAPLARSHSPDVPSLLTVTQTAGKVIDYGHASRAKGEGNTRETFKREQLSSERTVKMFPSSSSSSPSAPKVDKPERRQIRLDQAESSKHGDRDYRRTSSDHHKSNLSTRKEFPPMSKSRNLDRDYRHDRPKPIPSPETRNEISSRRSLSASGSKPHSSSSKKSPTPTMISDFSASSPKVYPHTCSLCHIECDQEKDWFDHVNTVNHTAACRDLRNKYPDWKPNLPRGGRYGGRALWDPKDHSPSHSVSRSLSCSLSPSPPSSRHRGGSHPHKPHGRPRPNLPHYHPSYQPHTGTSPRGVVKRPHDDATKFSSHPSQYSSSSKAGRGFKHGSLQSTKAGRSVMKPGTKTAKLASAKAADTTAKPVPAKKKKKPVTLASQDSSFVDRLVYLTGIPKDASEQEATDLVRSFGKINNVILMPCSEEGTEKDEGQKASVCMVKAEHAQALSNASNLSIRDQQITASGAKKPEAVHSSQLNNSKPAPGQDKGAAGDGPGGDAHQKTPSEKGMVLITGLPESGWSESDIVALIQPFGTASDIIIATRIGKVLVLVPDMDIAEEMVKVNTFSPMKMKESELKMILLKQCISLSTPVALYNLLMGSEDPESSVPVGWSSLLVISNVPNMPCGSSEVQKLVRRFGTVINTLELNSMVICEMATAAMALSVYKRFQMFPCIIQRNPLFFSRKPDPKANTHTKVISAFLDPPEDLPANGRGSKTAAAAVETAHKEDSESPPEKVEKDNVVKDEEMKSVEEDEAPGESGSKDKDQNQLLADVVSDESAAQDGKPDVHVETDMKETSAAENVIATGEEMKSEQTPDSETKTASPEAPMPELPKVTPEMVKALLVECRTRIANQPNNAAASANAERAATQAEEEPGEAAAEETQEPAKNRAEEEEHVKKEESERKDREARKEKEGRERRERERRAWEKEKAKKEKERDERARREREKREEERKEWERRERARKERKRTYGEASSGARSSHRLEGYRQSSGRDDKYPEPDRRMVSRRSRSEPVSLSLSSTHFALMSNQVEEEEEEEEEDFPFNMSDFVTVDEVGEVADLPNSPTIPMETSEEDAATSVQQDTPGDAHMDATTETPLSDIVTPLKSNEPASEAEPETDPAAETLDTLPSSDLTSGLMGTTAELPAAAPQAASSPSQGDQGDQGDQGSTAGGELLPTAAPGVGDSSSNSPATGEVKEEKEDSAACPSQTEEEVAAASDKTKKESRVQDEGDRTAPAPPVESGKHETNTEESVTKKLKMESPLSTDPTLPPFDPSNPVGLEFLVPKTGFFCKACNRFFSGTKEAEISHCKTLKHYESLQKYLQSKKMATVTTKPDLS